MEPLASRAVELLGTDVARGVARAVEHRLAGLFLEGAGDRLDEARRALLRRVAAREAADVEQTGRDTEAVLDALDPLRPVVLKGLALAAFWPRPSLRPAGDLDLLLGEHELEAAAARLEAAGYQRLPPQRGGRLRPRPTGSTFASPPTRRTSVDIHAYLFRSIGAGVSEEALCRRARPGEVRGRPVRLLDEADQLMFVLLHAAKHGARAIKWLLDCYALSRHAGDHVWRQAAQRAQGFGAGRPFWAAASLLATLPGANVPETVLRGLSPPAWTRPFISRLVHPGPQVSQWEAYALEWILEESLIARVKRVGGILERWAARR